MIPKDRDSDTIVIPRGKRRVIEIVILKEELDRDSDTERIVLETVKPKEKL